MRPVSRARSIQTARNRSLAMRKAVRTPKTRQIRRKETMNHAVIRKEITEHLTKYWDFSEEQLADLSIFHLGLRLPNGNFNDDGPPPVSA